MGFRGVRWPRFPLRLLRGSSAEALRFPTKSLRSRLKVGYEFPKTTHPTAKHSSWKSHDPAYGSVSHPRLLLNWLGQPNGSGSGNSLKVSQYGCERPLPLVFVNDEGRNDSVGFRPPYTIRNSATTKFYPANLLGMHPSISLVADPPRRKIARTHFPSLLPLFYRVAEPIIPLINRMSRDMLSGRIGVWVGQDSGIEYLAKWLGGS